MPRTRSHEHALLTRGVTSETAILIAGVTSGSPGVKKKRLAVVRAILSLFLLFAVTDGSWAQTCKKALAEIQTLARTSDQLARKLAKMKPCSQAQIATVQKRYKIMVTFVRTGDWITTNCPGYRIDKAGRDRNNSTLRALSSNKAACATTRALEDIEEELDDLDKLLE
jgi:hypothetical protein